MNLSDCGADHALGHAIGAGLHLPHGLAVGLVLAETLDVSRASCADRLERVADALGEPDDGSGDGSRAVAAVHRLLAAAGFPTCADEGIGPEQIEALVPAAVEDYCLAVDAHDSSRRTCARRSARRSPSARDEHLHAAVLDTHPVRPHRLERRAGERLPGAQVEDRAVAWALGLAICRTPSDSGRSSCVQVWSKA